MNIFVYYESVTCSLYNHIRRNAFVSFPRSRVGMHTGIKPSMAYIQKRGQNTDVANIRENCVLRFPQ